MKNTPIISFIVVAIVLIGGGIFVYRLQGQPVQNQTEMIELEEKDNIETGIRYVNTRYGFTVNYPEGWEVNEYGWSNFSETEVLAFNPISRTYKNIDGHTIDPIAIGVNKGKFPLGIEMRGEETRINKLTMFKIESYRNQLQYLLEHPNGKFYFSIENRTPGIAKAMDVLSGEDRFPNVETAADLTPQEKTELEQAFKLVLYSFTMME